MNVERGYFDADCARFHKASVHIRGEMFRRRLVQRKTNGAAERIRMQGVFTFIVGAHAHKRVLVDGDRQYVAVIVIGVFAQQIDAPGRSSHCRGRRFKYFLEAAH